MAVIDRDTELLLVRLATASVSTPNPPPERPRLRKLIRSLATRLDEGFDAAKLLRISLETELRECVSAELKRSSADDIETRTHGSLAWIETFRWGQHDNIDAKERAAFSMLANAIRRTRLWLGRHTSSGSLSKSQYFAEISILLSAGNYAIVPFVVVKDRLAFVVDAIVVNLAKDQAARSYVEKAICRGSQLGSRKVWTGGAHVTIWPHDLYLGRSNNLLLLAVDVPSGLVGRESITERSFELPFAIGAHFATRATHYPKDIACGGELDERGVATRHYTENVALKATAAALEGYELHYACQRTGLPTDTSSSCSTLTVVDSYFEVLKACRAHIARARRRGLRVWIAAAIALTVAALAGGAWRQMKARQSQDAIRTVYVQSGPWCADSSDNCLSTISRGANESPGPNVAWPVRAAAINALSVRELTVARLDSDSDYVQSVVAIERSTGLVAVVARPRSNNISLSPRYRGQRDVSLSDSVESDPDAGAKNLRVLELFSPMAQGWTPFGEPISNARNVRIVDTREGETISDVYVQESGFTEDQDFAIHGKSVRFVRLRSKNNASASDVSSVEWLEMGEGRTKLLMQIPMPRIQGELTRIWTPTQPERRYLLFGFRGSAFDRVVLGGEDGKLIDIVESGAGRIDRESTADVIVVHLAEPTSRSNPRLITTISGITIVKLPPQLKDVRCAIPSRPSLICFDGSSAFQYDISNDGILPQPRHIPLALSGDESPFLIWRTLETGSVQGSDHVYSVMAPLLERNESRGPRQFVLLGHEPEGLFHQIANLSLPNDGKDFWVPQSQGYFARYEVLDDYDRWVFQNEGPGIFMAWRSLPDRALLERSDAIRIVELKHPGSIFGAAHLGVNDAGENPLAFFSADGNIAWISAGRRLEVKSRNRSVSNPKYMVDLAPIDGLSVSANGSRAIECHGNDLRLYEWSNGVISKLSQAQLPSCTRRGSVSWQNDSPIVVSDCVDSNGVVTTTATTLGYGTPSTVTLPPSIRGRILGVWQAQILGFSLGESNKTVTITPTRRHWDKLASPNNAWTKDESCTLNSDLSSIEQTLPVVATSLYGGALLFGIRRCGWLSTNAGRTWHMVKLPHEQEGEHWVYGKDEEGLYRNNIDLWALSEDGEILIRRADRGPEQFRSCAYSLKDDEYATPGCFQAQSWMTWLDDGLERLVLRDGILQAFSRMGRTYQFDLPPLEKTTFLKWARAETTTKAHNTHIEQENWNTLAIGNVD